MMTSTLTLLTGMVCLYIFGGFMMDGISKFTLQILSTSGTTPVTEQSIYTLVIKSFFLLVLLLTPVVITIVTTAVVAQAVQDGGRIDLYWDRISFDMTKLNPLSGFGRLFNKDALVEMLKSLIKLVVIAFIAYRVLRDEVQNITFLAEADVPRIMSYMGNIAFKIVTHTCGIMLIIALLDLMYVKWRYIDNLKMTKQEVKDESKESDGNPEIKGKIRQLQFQMARRRMIKIIPTADVVITNPTHFAVALKYDRDHMAAPLVLAKGADLMALAIKDIAREHNVTLVENRFLARELYEQVKENEPIPEALYAAVAEVLAYVYRLKGKM